MKSEPINIKALRKKLGLSQVELAIALCVTQATIARWEADKCTTQPSGDADRRLRQLQAALAMPEDNRRLREILESTGGAAALAALLSLGSSTAMAAGLVGVGALFGPLGIAGGAAAGLLYRFLRKAQSANQKKRPKGK